MRGLVAAGVVAGCILAMRAAETSLWIAVPLCFVLGFAAMAWARR